jgi:3-phenylpropionate/trans-cinnamate dioxygenase ferredoxin reductase subunit
MTNGRVVIVGASLAGGRAAEQLRRGGWTGTITLIGEEPDRPYDRPPLSKKLIRGQIDELKLFFRAAEWYDEHRIELVTGRRAKGLDTTAREVELDDGRRVAFDRLIIATGATARPLTCEGATLPGVHLLRTLEDARAIRREVQTKKRVVVVGAGVIGAEVAASCRDEGLEVVMLEAAEKPLLRAFGADVGTFYADQHRAKGVELRCGTMVRALRGADRVEEVVTTHGDTIACDFVVVGIGVTPETRWLEGSGVRTDRGVIVDAHCESNVPGIYAAGDVACGPARVLGGKHVIVESVDNAQTQGATIVANLLGKPEEHDTVPFFWSDQFDLKMQSVGHVSDYDRVVVRGSMEARAFVAFHLRQGKLAFAIGVNRLKEIAGSKKLIAAGVDVPPEALADETIALSTLLPAKG